MIHNIKLLNARKKGFWIRFINKNRLANLQSGINKIEIDFSQCTFIEPFHIVVLSCLIEEYYLKGMKIEFTNCIHLELNEYLNKINFYDYWNPSFDRNTYTPNKIATNLCLWKLKPEMITSYVVRAQEYFENNFNSNRTFQPLNVSLAELFNNINDHAESNVSGYCISQYYPNIEKVKIAVCDFGIGIPNSVNKYLRENDKSLLSEGNAIIKSLEKSFSCKSHPHNRGWGLDTIRSIVLDCSGELRIISNKGAYELKNGKEEIFELKDSFSGTQIEIILDSSKFDQKEDDYIVKNFHF